MSRGFLPGSALAPCASAPQTRGNAVALHTCRYGDRGPPLLILHGLLGSHRNWQSVARALASTYRVYTADLRNHGRSPHSEQMDYAHLTSDVSALIDELGLDHVHLLGHSLGGKVAMCVALAEPERVESLVVVDIAPVAYPDRNAAILASLRALPLEAITDRASADRSLAVSIGESSLRQFLLTNLVQTADGFSWQANLDALAAASSSLAGFPEFGPETAFPGPALFVFGEHSPYRVAAHRHAIEALYPSAHYAAIPDAGHWPHIERPEPFLAAIRNFLAIN